MPRHVLFTEGTGGGKHRLTDETHSGGQHAFYVAPSTTLRWGWEAGNDWTVLSANAALTVTTSTSDEGTHCLAIDRTSGSADIQILSPRTTASPGDVMRVLASVNCGSNLTYAVRPDIYFYDAADNFLEGNTGGFNPYPAGTWIKTRTISSSAPSGTAWARVRYQVDGSGGVYTQYLDRVLLGPAAPGATSPSFAAPVDPAEWDIDY